MSISESFFSGDRHRPETSDFLCGVVEGFYGRPWTYPQRRELFRRMQSMGMNSYLYAPKDDLKHRHSWRELYNEKEEEHMRSLIAAADEHNVLFIFAISPGSDVVYSHEADVNFLKSKLQQATQLGCRAFALLFDDIDTRLCPSDQEVFGSPGRAQVTLTNEIYNSLGCPETFLFCPTEYCASRAVPNTPKSAYLATLGSELAQGINILWTGPIVVSKRIPTLAIRDLSRLLKRSLVIWDNLHANDYDQRRVFLGPYSGRPLALRRRKLIQGVLTNPNCEFEANFVALHTLAQWARFADPAHAEEVSVADDLADIGDDLEKEKLESSSCDMEKNSEDQDLPTPTPSKAPVYKPRQALLNALRDWLSLMLQDQRSTNAPRVPSDHPSPSPMDTDSPVNQEGGMQVETVLTKSSSESRTDHEPSKNFDSQEAVSLLGLGLVELELLADLFYLPFNHGPAALKILELGHWLRDHAYAAPCEGSTHPESSEWGSKYNEFLGAVSAVNELREKVQHLPHAGVVYDLAPYLTEMNAVLAMVLDYFRWIESGVMAYRTFGHLRRHLTWFSPGYSEMAMSGEHEPWMFRGGLITEIQRILPLESAQDLFPAPSRVGPSLTTTPAGALSAGGLGPLLGDIPISSPPLLVPNTQPPTITLPLCPPPKCLSLGISVPYGSEFQPRRPYLVRPFRPEDKPKVYALWSRLLLQRIGLSVDLLPDGYKDLPGDRYCLAYLNHSPQHCLVVEGPPLYFQEQRSENDAMVEGDWRIVGFALAAPDVAAFTRDREELCMSQLRVKYPRSNGSSEQAQSVLQLPRKCSIGGSRNVSIEDFITFSVDWFHNERTTKTSAITEAAVTEEPPEPLGASIVDQPMVVESDNLSVAGDQTQSSDLSQSLPKTENVTPIAFLESSDHNNETPSAEMIILPTQLPDPTFVPYTNPTPQLQPFANLVPNAALPLVFGRPGSMAHMEAIHSALISHPATILVELDDIGFGCCAPRIPTPLMLINHHLGVGFDPPELILDEVARRLFVCLLAGLKTWACNGVHVELDAISESRADLYRRFGFYPVAAASTDFISVLGRLI